MDIQIYNVRINSMNYTPNTGWRAIGYHVEGQTMVEVNASPVNLSYSEFMDQLTELFGHKLGVDNDG